MQWDAPLPADFAALLDALRERDCRNERTRARARTASAACATSVDWIVPAGRRRARVHAFVTTRNGGVSRGARRRSTSAARARATPATPRAVAENRRRIARVAAGAAACGSRRCTARDVVVVDADVAAMRATPPRADAAVTRAPDVVLAIRIADCLPVLFADRDGARRRRRACRLARARRRRARSARSPRCARRAGVDRRVARARRSARARSKSAPTSVDAFCDRDDGARGAFRAAARTANGWPTSHALARQRLARCGVRDVARRRLVHRTPTPRASSRIRRDGATGRMATLIWHRALKRHRAPHPRSVPSAAMFLHIVVAASPAACSRRSPRRRRCALRRAWISAARVVRRRRAARRRVPRAPAARARNAAAHRRVMVTVLAGLLAFFLLEKLVLWRHATATTRTTTTRTRPSTTTRCIAHARSADDGRSGLMILIGNSVHNFCDGIVIAAAFLADDALGIATTLAIVAHAVPQQVGDFAVLLHSGFTRGKRVRVQRRRRASRRSPARSPATSRWRGMQRAAADRARDRVGEPALRRRRRPDPEPAPAPRAARDREADADASASASRVIALAHVAARALTPTRTAIAGAIVRVRRAALTSTVDTPSLRDRPTLDRARRALA